MKKSDVRHDLLTTAGRLFYEQGYNGTGINQIIEESGVCKSSLYQHYRSKEDLLVDYLNESAANVNGRIKGVVDLHVSPQDKLMAIFDLLGSRVGQKDYHGCRFLNISSEIPDENVRIRSIIKAQKDHMREVFREILKPLQKEDRADELYLVYEGAQSAVKIHGEKWPVEAAKKAIMAML